MADQGPVYLDDNGNPKASVYLDDQGNPVKAPGKTLEGFGENVLTSAGKFVGDLASGVAAAAHPVMRAAQGFYDPQVALENAQAIKNTVRNLPTTVPAAVRGAGQALKDRYGSLDAIGNTLYTDPVGVLGDISTVAGMATGAGELAGATRLARATGQVEKYTNPLRAVTAPVSATARRVAPILEEGSVSAYERMLKPNKSTIQGMSRLGDNLGDRSREAARQLLHDPNAVISHGGAHAYEDATQAIQRKVDDLITQHPEARGSVSHLQRELDAGIKNVGEQWGPSSDRALYTATAKDILNDPRILKNKRAVIDTSVEQALGMAPNASEVRVVGKEPIPRVLVSKARRLTQGTYRNLGDKAYGELKGPDVEARKAGARGGRAIVNEGIPAAEPLNTEVANRIDLGQILDEAAFRSGKHDPLKLGEQVMLSGAAAAMHPGIVGAALINRPAIGSRVARGVSKAATGIGAAGRAGISPELLRAALLARMMGEQP